MSAFTVKVFVLVVLLCWSRSAEASGCGAYSCELELYTSSLLQTVQNPARVKVEDPDAMESMQKVSSFVHTSKTATSPNRHLATIRPPQPMMLSKGNITLNFQSAVPTFGAGANYIALLHKYDDELWHALRDYKLFCSGPGNSHRVPMRILGGESDVAYKTHLIWHCDWPGEEAHAGSYQVFLEEADGNKIGHLNTSYDPTLLKKYNTVACVTSVWPGKTSLLALPQWLEYNLIHGVDHFLVYTMTGTDEKVMDIYRPYLNDGVATRVHLEMPDQLSSEFKADDYSTQAWFANDCLYRVKNHARWMSPTRDVDEYFMVTHKKQAQTRDASEKIWDSMNADWEINTGVNSTLQFGGQPPNTNTSIVHSISFGQYRFARAEAMDALQISSVMREEQLAGVCPKYVVNPAYVNALFIHWPTSWVAGAVGLGVPHHLGVLNHYRIEYSSNTTVIDSALVPEIPAVKEAVEARFKSKWETLATKLGSSMSVLPDMYSKTAIEGASDLEHELSMTFRAWIDDFNKLDQIEIIVPPRFGSPRS